MSVNRFFEFSFPLKILHVVPGLYYSESISWCYIDTRVALGRCHYRDSLATKA
jgi:hypothetical protein